MRCIDADALSAWFDEHYFDDEDVPVGYVTELINEAPTINQEETGEWVKVHGYVTPGGDPVWACPKCGKGIHVYGIEHGTYGKDIADHQWVACPNCGMKLK